MHWPPARGTYDVGVPTGKKQVLAVVVKRRPGTDFSIKWKLHLQQRMAAKPMVGAFLGRDGYFFLKRLPGDKEVFSFSQACNHPHPRVRHGPPATAGGVRSHPTDDAPSADAEDLSWDDFVKLLQPKTTSTFHQMSNGST